MKYFTNFNSLSLKPALTIFLKLCKRWYKSNPNLLICLLKLTLKLYRILEIMRSLRFQSGLLAK